jgi:hypothetical protein
VIFSGAAENIEQRKAAGGQSCGFVAFNNKMLFSGFWFRMAGHIEIGNLTNMQGAHLNLKLSMSANIHGMQRHFYIFPHFSNIYVYNEMLAGFGRINKIGLDTAL